MQACPYDALYIDPETHTAAKCNYCAHRVDVGLEPACVNVCPEEAIVSGDLDNPNSTIAQLLSRQQVTARKTEKGTKPNLFYINGDESSLNPTATEKGGSYLWNAQATGVGHFAKYAEKLAFSNGDVLDALMDKEEHKPSAKEVASKGAAKSIDVLMGKPRRVYDTPDKGVLWGWEVSAYVWTKAIAAGAFLIPFLALLLGNIEVSAEQNWWALGLSLFFLTATGLLLVMDLDQPKRFLYVLLRPQWNSWLVKGGYAITFFGGLLTLWGVSMFLGWETLANYTMYGIAIFALITAVYTAFLFAQAKGRDFWQSPTLAIHMLVHSFMAGAAIFGIVGLFVNGSADWNGLLTNVLYIAIGVNLVTMLFELTTPHPTDDAKTVVKMITKGRYSNLFWLGVVLVGNILPLAILMFGGTDTMMLAAAGVATLIGIYCTEHIWVEAPQRISLT
jgi:formate-dependent nitrite reductase membrane component NrfD